MIFRILLLIVGVFSCSTAVIWIKLSNEHPVILSSLRLLVAAFVLTPYFIRDLHKHRDTYSFRHLISSVWPGMILGVHFISWIIGARMTPAVNSTLIVNLVPIAMPFFLFVMLKEKLFRNEILATVLAIGGMCILGSADFNISMEYFRGDVLCLISMLFFSYYLALGRLNRHFPSLWLYLVPLYFVGGLFCLIVSLFFLNPIKPYPMREILLILALGIIPTIVGHSILNHSMKYLRGQVVSIINMGQFIFAGIMAYFIFMEIPSFTFYTASLILIISGVLVSRREKKDPMIRKRPAKISDHPAFGMWKDRREKVESIIKKLREGRDLC